MEKMFSSSLYKIENSQEDAEKKCSKFDADHMKAKKQYI